MQGSRWPKKGYIIHMFWFLAEITSNQYTNVLKYHTNDLMHCRNTTTTLHAEGGHSKIKHQLNKTSIDTITLILRF